MVNKGKYKPWGVNYKSFFFFFQGIKSNHESQVSMQKLCDQGDF